MCRVILGVDEKLRKNEEAVRFVAREPQAESGTVITPAPLGAIPLKLSHLFTLISVDLLFVPRLR